MEHCKEVFEREGGHQEVVQLFARAELAMEVTEQAVKQLYGNRNRRRISRINKLRAKVRWLG